jgi:hypothetical protein
MIAFVLAGADRGAPETSTIDVANGIVASGTAEICASATISAMPKPAQTAEIAMHWIATLLITSLFRKIHVQTSATV